MKKIIIIVLCSCFILGCDSDISYNSYQKESVFQDFKMDVFLKCSDSLNANVARGFEQIAKRNRDSAFYYAGRAEAFWEMEDYVSKKKFK